MEPSDAEPSNRAAVLRAWLVHAFTASGAVLAILALLALEQDDVRLALLWLLAALAVDGIDGTLARRAGVKALVPRIDGAVLDLVIDYLNYVFVPTVLIWKAGLVPAGWAAPLAALIQLSALYVFARADMKSEDNYFRGFPALWNVVAFYLWVIQPGPGVGAASVIVLALASFAPIHFVHPFRIPDYGRWPALLALVWAGATTALLWPGWSPELARFWLWVSLGSAAVLVALGLLRSLRGRRSGEAPPAGADGEP